ncbi:MAG: HD domain-containing protein, partial [Nitrospirae bacterium]|nr:HD domain-containing protein [Nitrospirota bacterium]
LIEKEGAVRIDLIGEFFYINDSRVRYPIEFLLNFDFLIREFRRRELGTVSFVSSLKKEDMKEFLKTFLNAPYSNTPFEKMESLLERIESIQVEKLKNIKEDESIDKRRLVKKTYFNAVSFTRGVISKIRAGEKVSLKKAKRVVESVVDTLLSEESLLIGMTAIKDYDEYTYHHSVNVSILSIAIGQKIGLHRRALTELGLVALFHDIGKMEIPLEVLNKPTAFTEDEWKLVRRHPFWGARTILKLRGFDKTSIQSAIVAFEHHMHYDHSGYPKVRRKLPLDFYSKIVSIADQYDAMTSSRVYSRVPLPPDRALSVMMERAGTQIDPILFKFFINMVGVYPVGSLVLLDTKEMGLVYECNPLFADRPRVMIIVDSSGRRLKEGWVVDLTERDPTGRYLRSIVKTLDPNKYKINLAEYLL